MLSKNEIAKNIASAATRALEETLTRNSKIKKLPTELGGRDGPEPTRFGDWEKNGIISDF
jgi:hypothetical protein